MQEDSDRPEIVKCRNCKSDAVVKRAGSDAWVQCGSCGSLYELVEQGTEEERPLKSGTPRRRAWEFVRETLRRHPVLPAVGLAIAIAVAVVKLSGLTVSATSQGLLIQRAPSGATTTLVAGRWHGRARELEGPDDHGFLKLKHIYATTLVFSKQDGIYEMQLSGSFSVDATPEVAKREISGHGTMSGADHVELHYLTRTKDGIVSSGMMYLHFYPSSPRAEGFYIASSVKVDGMICGWIELQR